MSEYIVAILTKRVKYMLCSFAFFLAIFYTLSIFGKISVIQTITDSTNTNTTRNKVKEFKNAYNATACKQLIKDSLPKNKKGLYTWLVILWKRG